MVEADVKALEDRLAGRGVRASDVSEPTPQFWDGKPVVVTGGAGFLGRAVVRDLDALGADATVVALGRSRPARSARRARGGRWRRRRHPPRRQRRRDRLQPRQPGAARLRQHDDDRATCSSSRAPAGVAKLVSACTVCAYPKFTASPFSEDDLWDGYPEESNAPYGLAKKMMLVLSDAYRRQYGFDSCVPIVANLYGPNDNFDLESSHVIAAMIRKYVEARERGDEQVVLWGTGKPSREFLYVDDAARALLLAAERLDGLGPGEHRHRHRDQHPHAGGDDRATGRATTARPSGTRRAPTANRAGSSTSRGPARSWASRRRVPLEDGLRETIESFRAQHIAAS